MSGIRATLSRPRVWLFVLAWATLFGAFWYVAHTREQNPVELLVSILQGLQASRYAVLWLLLVYLVRPLLLLPVSVLTVFAGFLFGPVIGAVIFTILPQFLDFDANVKVLIFSSLIIIVMMVAPGGLDQMFKAFARWSSSRWGGGRE